MKKKKESMRSKSNIQEKRIASRFNGARQVIGSGSTPFLKGDVVVGKLFIEAKTKAKPSKQITIKKEWLEKAKEQSYSTHKEDYALALSFGDGKDYYMVEDSLFEDLYKAREALRWIIDTLGVMNGLIDNNVGMDLLWNIRKIIQEEYQ